MNPYLKEYQLLTLCPITLFVQQVNDTNHTNNNKKNIAFEVNLYKSGFKSTEMLR